MATTKKLMGTTAAAGADFLAVEDVFSTWLYTGNGSTQTITNGIDLAGEGGLVWIKDRSAAFNHAAHDTEQGATKYLKTNDTDLALTTSGFSFNSDGFTVGSLANDNRSGDNFASWTFRKAPRFFDVVTWTGTGSAQNISHNLGVTPGCIMIKSTSISGNWWVWHRTLPDARYGLYLNSTSGQTTSNTTLDWTDPTDTVFRVGTSALTNSSGATYVAYLFAHDPLGPSGDGSDGLIACGSGTCNASGYAEVELGWEPQWILLKRTNGSGDWFMSDNMRGMYATGTNKDQNLAANNSAAEAESTTRYRNINATGFNVALIGDSEFVYIAIRRGPMRQPESGTEVYTAGLNSSGSYTVSTGWPADFAIQKDRSGTLSFSRPYARLTGTNYLETTSTAAEATGGSAGWANNTGYSNATASSTVDWVFRRAPGFFDVVAYTGDGNSSRQLNHNLNSQPELIITKSRSSASDWRVIRYAPNVTNTSGSNEWFDTLSTSAALYTGTINSVWGPSAGAPTETYYLPAYVSGSLNAVNASGVNYIAYLFATLPGVSKVGSYTGTATLQTIDCGFTSGARFVLIKRTDSTGDWVVFDTQRGITSGDDPSLDLNNTSAEDASYNPIDPNSSGFNIRQISGSDLNVSGATYIFLAIA